MDHFDGTSPLIVELRVERNVLLISGDLSLIEYYIKHVSLLKTRFNVRLTAIRKLFVGVVCCDDF